MEIGGNQPPRHLHGRLLQAQDSDTRSVSFYLGQRVGPEGPCATRANLQIGALAQAHGNESAASVIHRSRRTHLLHIPRGSVQTHVRPEHPTTRQHGGKLSAKAAHNTLRSRQAREQACIKDVDPMTPTMLKPASGHKHVDLITAASRITSEGFTPTTTDIDITS